MDFFPHRFRVVAYGKNGKIALPDSLKSEIKTGKLQRELRRAGIGQHTIEKALGSHVRVNTYKKIVFALQNPKKKTRAELSESGRDANNYSALYRAEWEGCYSFGPLQVFLD